MKRNRLIMGIYMGFAVLCMCGICVSVVSAATQYRDIKSMINNYALPVLTKGTGYVLTLDNTAYTCVSLEQQLGLKRGDIVSIETDELGKVTVNFAKDVAITDSQVAILEKAVNKPLSGVTTK